MLNSAGTSLTDEVSALASSTIAPALLYLLYPCSRSSPVSINGLTITGSSETAVRDPLYVLAVDDLLKHHIDR